MEKNSNFERDCVLNVCVSTVSGVGGVCDVEIKIMCTIRFLVVVTVLNKSTKSILCVHTTRSIGLSLVVFN